MQFAYLGGASGGHAPSWSDLALLDIQQNAFCDVGHLLHIDRERQDFSAPPQAEVVILQRRWDATQHGLHHIGLVHRPLTAHESAGCGVDSAVAARCGVRAPSCGAVGEGRHRWTPWSEHPAVRYPHWHKHQAQCGACRQEVGGREHGGEQHDGKA